MPEFEFLQAGDTHELGDTSRPPDESQRQAQRVALSYARDAAEARMFLQMLGINPSRTAPDADPAIG